MMNEDRNRIIMIFEGKISREITQIADFMELYGGFSEQDRQEYRYEGSKLAKLTKIISMYFPEHTLHHATQLKHILE
ncbi:hypothetical protein CW705_04635 [Candidatus Bathyarchaeota archaeon]|nr:MAG: hypothetical protein CW705_04635 [Candidatus Bathyarchaeota archaeon]